MQPNSSQFIEFALQHHVLRFGEFTLKSGRISPYFFNAGLFNSGASLLQLGRYYAHAITAAQVEFDMLFGPAYKGIPLATTTALALAQHNQRDVPICFNRKEPKQHGEKGSLIGAAIQGKVLIIDDVITAGTAVREAKTLIEQHGGRVAGIAIAFDRQERGLNQQTTIEEITNTWQIPVIPIANLHHLRDYLTQDSRFAEQLAAITHYQQEYGV